MAHIAGVWRDPKDVVWTWGSRLLLDGRRIIQFSRLGRLRGSSLIRNFNPQVVHDRNDLAARETAHWTTFLFTNQIDQKKFDFQAISDTISVTLLAEI